MSSSLRLPLATFALAALASSAPAALVACKRGDAAEAPPDATKMPVAVVTLHDEPVKDASEYLAQLVSRHQVALYPQVSGNVSAIFVKPGQRVKAGTALLQIDPRKEAANLSSQVAARAQKEANLDLAKKNEARSSMLLAEGLVSRQQYDQDRSLRDVAEQELKSAQAMIQAQETQLAYYRIAAPFDGVVGDVPVKLGDYVSTATKLTSLDENATLEAYVNVPVDRAKALTDASHVELLQPDGGVLAESKVSFIAEEANPQTQSILVKAAFPNASSLRASQVVRARVVWSEHPGLRVPTAAVWRQTGQYFAYVAEPGDGKTDGMVARQKAVTLGDIDDGRFVVLAGLKAGDRLVVSQVQKLHDGAPIAPDELRESASAAHEH